MADEIRLEETEHFCGCIFVGAGLKPTPTIYRKNYDCLLSLLFSPFRVLIGNAHNRVRHALPPAPPPILPVLPFLLLLPYNA